MASNSHVPEPRAHEAHASPDAITLRQVRKTFGDFHAVNGVSLRIAQGEIFGLIGHNGAGKSTLFKMMLGLLPASGGEILVGGNAIDGPSARRIRQQVGYLPENVVLYDNLDGMETLRYFARLKSAPVSQCAEMLERVGLSHAGKRPVRAYSKGMRQRLGFAQALLGSPRLLFLDEPTNGLDPRAIRDFHLLLGELRQQGVTVIITSHILAELQERVDRLAILSHGELQAVGSVQELRDELHMPLTLEIELDGDSDAQLAARHIRQTTGMEAEITPQGLRLVCTRAQKVPLLASIVQLGSQVRDIQLHEPSLEDVFFGLSAR